MRLVRSLIVISLAASVASCNLLHPLVFIGEHKRKVPAEFDKLTHSRVAILVWTDQAILFDYPHARFELATYIGDKLFSEMAQRKLETELVDPRDVENYIQKQPKAQIDPRAVGRQFKTDYVIYLEVLQFQFRDPTQPQFLQGRIEASVSVHDMRVDPDQTGRYDLTAVKVIHPENAPTVLTATNSPLIREATYRKLAEEVARKFYEHTLELS